MALGGKEYLPRTEWNSDSVSRGVKEAPEEKHLAPKSHTLKTKHGVESPTETQDSEPYRWLMIQHRQTMRKHIIALVSAI